jgi:hypothetical protein
MMRRISAVGGEPPNQCRTMVVYTTSIKDGRSLALRFMIVGAGDGRILS